MAHHRWRYRYSKYFRWYLVGWMMGNSITFVLGHIWNGGDTLKVEPSGRSLGGLRVPERESHVVEFERAEGWAEWSS